MSELEEIARKHKTQKVPHGYMPIYERFFSPLRGKIIELLEIGVAGGNSIRTWREYFPHAIIVGVDKVIEDKRDPFLIQCDATKDFDKIKEHGPFDIIIDDGSHWAQEQLDSFAGLWDSVKPGGYYVIEDLFALYDKIWNPSGPTIVDLIAGRLKSILVQGDSIQEVHVFGRNDINGIMFLRKRNEVFRVQPIEEFKM